VAHDLTIAEIKALLGQRIEELVAVLAPGKPSCRKGDYWMPVNPVRSDNRPGSFWILLRKNPGVWKDEATGETGDVIRLIQHTQSLATPGDAIRWAKDWLGIERIPASQIARVKSEAAAQHRHDEEQAALDLERQRRAAKAFWLDCWALVTLTPGEQYLLGRGIDVRTLPRYPSALRYCPNMPYYEVDAAGERRETRWPGLVACMTSCETEQIVAIHRTWLAHDGVGAEHRETKGKAPLDPPRKIWPAFKGSAIRLARGETGLSVAEASKLGKRDTLALTEGIEDGLTVALACPDLRVWAAGSLGNLASIKVPACTAEVIVCADNDWGKPQAERLLAKGIAALAAQGVKVSVARSPVGKDVNDCLRGEAA